jgi:hypothetical protein
MAVPLSAALARPGPSEEEDLARLAAGRLRQALRQRHDGAVLADLLEEDVRSALGSLEALRAHLEDVFRALLAERPLPLDLLEAADDTYAQAAVLELESTLASLRRHLSQAAARVAGPPPTRPSEAEGPERDTRASAEHQHPHRV